MNYSVSLACLTKPGCVAFGRFGQTGSLAALAFVASISAAQSTSLLGGGLDVDVGLGLGNSGIEADVGVGIGRSGVGADVDVGVGRIGRAGASGLGIGVSLKTSSPAANSGTSGGTPASGAVDPSTVSSNPEAAAKARRMLGSLTCARGGNTQVFNGFSVVDRNGQMVGWVHDAQITPDQTITQLQFQTVRNVCVGLRGGSYSVSGSEVSVNMDGSRFR